MDQVEYTHWLPYTPQTIYEFLSNPDMLAAVVGRIAQAKVVEQSDANHGKLAVVLDLPARRTINTIGDVEGNPYEYLSFKTYEPFPLEFAWRLSPAERDGRAGTEVVGTLGFDLTTFGLPMAGMMVRGIIASELKSDLNRLEELLARHHS